MYQEYILGTRRHSSKMLNMAVIMKFNNGHYLQSVCLTEYKCSMQYFIFPQVTCIMYIAFISFKLYSKNLHFILEEVLF